MLNFTKHETDHAHKYPNINIIGILILIFKTEPKDRSATSFKHYSYHAQWHKDRRENSLAIPDQV